MILISFVVSTAQAITQDSAIKLWVIQCRLSNSLFVVPSIFLSNRTLNKLWVASGSTTPGYTVAPLIVSQPISSVGTTPPAVSKVIAPLFQCRPVMQSFSVFRTDNVEFSTCVNNHHQRAFLCAIIREPLMINILVRFFFFERHVLTAQYQRQWNGSRKKSCRLQTP